MHVYVFNSVSGILLFISKHKFKTVFVFVIQFCFLFGKFTFSLVNSHVLSKNFRILEKDGTPWWLSGKESTCSTAGFDAGQKDPPGRGHGNPLQYSCLENPMERGAWRATAHRIAKCRTRLSH